MNTELEIARKFYNIALNVSKTSRCLSRQIGAVLTTENYYIIATETNGPPKGLPSCQIRFDEDKFIREQISECNINILNHSENICPRRLLGFKSGKGLEMCVAVHAERNCILTAAKVGYPTNNGKLFLTCNIPCKDCLIEIINAGIKTIYVTHFSFYDSVSEYILKYSNLEIKDYKGNQYKLE